MKCGDATIDGLLAGDPSVKPLYPGADATAIEFLQDLLRGHGYRFLPDPRGSSYGFYGSATSLAVEDYRRKHGLGDREHAGSGLLRDLILREAPRATLSPAYVPLVLDTAFTPVLRFVWLTALFETGGAFGTLNLNTDQCGVSMGILQWSQKAGRLHQFLQACSVREPTEWGRICGDAGILDYTAKPNGGLDSSGFALDPAFELSKEPWRSKLQALGSSAAMQRVQLNLAAESYSEELARQRAYAKAIYSHRGFAFLLDIANQFGGGRAEQHYKLAASAGGGRARFSRQWKTR